MSDAYESSVYALFNDETNHMIFINSSDRSLRLSRSEVLDTFESIESNTSFIYFTKSMSSQSKSILDSRFHDSHSHPHSSTYHVKADSCSQFTLKQSPSTTAEFQYVESTPLSKKSQVITHDYAEKTKFPFNEMKEIIMKHELSNDESSNEKTTKSDELLRKGDLK